MELEDLDFDDIVVSVIDWQNAQRNNSNYQKQTNKISPSQIGLCLRQQFLNDAEIDSEIDDNLKKIFLGGNLIHDDFAYKILDKYFKEATHAKNIHIINEYPFRYYMDAGDVKIKVNGFIDDLLIMYDGEKELKIPIEVKSTGNVFYRLKEPKTEHVIQLMLYLKFTKSEFGYLWYIHKESFASKTFKIEFDEDIYNKIVKRSLELYNYKERGVIPPAEARINSNDVWFKNKCKYCKYANMCESIGNEEFK